MSGQKHGQGVTDTYTGTDREVERLYADIVVHLCSVPVAASGAVTNKTMQVMWVLSPST